MNVDSLGLLQTFVQVADTLSFVEAGRLQGVSASAVGKAIARLEQQLGARLFHRSTRSVALTPEGQQFLTRARRILGELELAEAELSSQLAEPRGILRVSLPLVSSLVQPALSDFMAAYPQVQLDLDFDDRLVDVIEEGYDAVLRVGEPTDSRLSARRIGSFRRYLVASPDYLKRKGTPRTPDDLQQHDCLHYRFPSTGKLQRWPTPPEVDVPVTMVCNEVHTRVCLALHGRGIAYVPEQAARAALASGELVTVLDDCTRTGASLYLLWPSGRHMLPKLRAFVDFMGEHLLADHSRRP